MEWKPETTMKPNPESMLTITGNKLENQLVRARKAGLSSFSDIEHRLELVRVIDGVEYVNDSKATDCDSAGYSLDQMDKTIIWLVGEAEEDSDYELLEESVENKVRSIILFGPCNGKALDPLKKLVSHYAKVDSVEEAVMLACEQAQEGEVVLFSPASSSFSLFSEYKERGEVFRAVVQNLM